MKLRRMRKEKVSNIFYRHQSIGIIKRDIHEFLSALLTVSKDVMVINVRLPGRTSGAALKLYYSKYVSINGERLSRKPDHLSMAMKLRLSKEAIDFAYSKLRSITSTRNARLIMMEITQPYKQALPSSYTTF